MAIDLIDRVSLDVKSMRQTADGYLVSSPRVARTGIQLYHGSEVGRPQMDTVRVYRPEAEVFSKDSMRTFAYKPLTNDHPDVPVTADNWADHAVGTAGGEVARDGEFMRIPLVIMDKAAVKAIQNGKKELSVGYSTDLKWGAGTTPDGQHYDAVQTAIRANHIAIVSEARGGDKLRLGDNSETYSRQSQPSASDDNVTGANKMADSPKTTTVVVDSISLEMSDTAAAVVARSVKDAADKITAANGQVATLTADAAKAKAEHDASVAKMTADHKVATDAKDAEITALKKQVEDAKLTPAKLDALVKDRAEVFSKAKTVLGDKLVIDGKSLSDVRKQVVDARLGDKAKGYTEDQVQIAFDTLTSDIKVDATDAVRATAAAFSVPGVNVSDKNAIYAARDKRLSDAWKTPTAA